MKQTIIAILMVLSAALSFAGDNMLTVLPELTLEQYRSMSVEELNEYLSKITLYDNMGIDALTTEDSKSDLDFIIAEDQEGPETLWIDCLAWATTQYKGTNVRSLYNVDDVRKALELAVKYLVPVDLSVTYSVVDTRSEADKLRMLADEMEQKQKDIEYIKSVLKALNN